MKISIFGMFLYVNLFLIAILCVCITGFHLWKPVLHIAWQGFGALLLLYMVIWLSNGKLGRIK